ncbi:Phosphotransferase [Sulfidibacter corallicola]|uniref:Phosphotransferase n=1 Tax=Sulfidibacter corallicola TaxID=2818388 RepID=A0A8A4TY37_SULCO|nr:phosphotransferase [Sulfidibacter corallicola]QTD54128.1 phosphotransferase [Sulfidibacter corallicola]
MANQAANQQVQTRTRKIGIDLDHTILNVAEGIEGSEILFGFKAFVMEQREQKQPLFIVAHEVDQAAEVEAHLENKGFFKDTGSGGLGFEKGNLIFVASEDEKVAKIAELGLTHFIDDQSATFAHASFPKETQPLVFGPRQEGASFPGFSEWSELTNYFYWEEGVSSQSGARILAVTPLKEHGDNFIYKVDTENDRSYILKHFLESTENAPERLETEINHLNSLHAVGIHNVPKPYWHRGCWALFSYLEGSSVTQVGENELAQFIDMLTQLDRKHEELGEQKVKTAAGARTRLSQFADELNGRWNAVLSACQRPDGPKDIMLFMLTDLEQLRQDNLNHFYLWIKREKWDKEAELAEKDLIFSPSDFGFHNTLKNGDNTLYFLDFEESGWDDPAKLLADFFYNTEQTLDIKDKLAVLDAFVKQREWDSNFIKRFWAIADLVAVEWILKTLEVVVPEEMRRLQYVNPGLDPKQLIKDRFKIAIKMREDFQPMEHLCKHDQLLDEEGEI